MTSMERRTTNPGKREREARKRHRRGPTWTSMTGWLKLGRKHSSRFYRALHLSVADAEKPGAERVMSLSADPPRPLEQESQS